MGLAFEPSTPHCPLYCTNFGSTVWVTVPSEPVSVTTWSTPPTTYSGMLSAPRPRKSDD